MYDNVPQDCFKLIQTIKSRHPNLSPIFDDLESNLTQRLWYQLSNNLSDISSSAEMQNGGDLIEMYQGLVIFIKAALNDMKYLYFVLNMLHNFKGKMNEALLFVQNIETNAKYKDEAKVFLKIIKGFCYLELNMRYECEDIIKEVEDDFNSKVEIDTKTYSLFYKLSLLFYEKQSDYDNFYLNAFQYLAYENEISQEDKLNLCFKMCVAILIGEKSYNFAELIEKDFFKLMQGTQFEWIANLILSFNSAKVDQFLNLLSQNQSNIQSNIILRDKVQFLQVKIRIAAILDIVFQKDKNNRTLTFNEICSHCQTSENDIEILCMKALSLGLIKGHIDQVEKVVVVDWIQPKYLDKEKIALLKNRFDSWIEKSDNVMKIFQENAKSLIKS